MSEDLIDRRQRMVAALALAAVDLPADMAAVSRHLIEAAAVCPGVTLSDLSPTGFQPGSRKCFLRRASQLIDEMLSELP